MSNTLDEQAQFKTKGGYLFTRGVRKDIEIWKATTPTHLKELIEKTTALHANNSHVGRMRASLLVALGFQGRSK